MVNKKRIIAFAIYGICLLGIPAKMILDQDRIFNEGQAFKFKCQPIDPNDPFRGKYVRLGFNPIQASNKGLPENQTGKYFGYVKVDHEGYAYIENVGIEYAKKSEDLDYVEVNLLNSNDSISTYALPFDRLYMNENKAQAAEDLYRNALRDDSQNVYAKVYISQGRFLLDDVYIDGVKLKDSIE